MKRQTGSVQTLGLAITKLTQSQVQRGGEVVVE